jgi:ketosteroid isomerase-like protein
LLVVVITFSCNNNKTQSDTKNRIRQTEYDFQQLLVSDGAAAAFYKFASDSAVIKRQNDSLIFGKEAIKKFYSNPIYKNAVAIWKPDFIDISDDGTLAYTFGKY